MMVTIDNKEITICVEHTFSDIEKAISILETLKQEQLRRIVLSTRSNNLPLETAPNTAPRLNHVRKKFRKDAFHRDIPSHTNQTPHKTRARKGKKHGGIQKNVEPLSNQDFRKIYPLRGGFPKYIRQAVFYETWASF